ncbi:MAG TPA: CocE/NonD family hydrolase [Candidatus Eremiobacteraceae bacterium]|nr:CocE/NonD family hydrolase [Candidatus Eremiobacteraceae bacterium]
MIVDRDAGIRMRDGVRLFASVFRPDDGVPRPIVLSVTPYGKDNTPDRIGMLFMRLAGVSFGKLNCSRLTGFESPDPAFWVDAGYNVIQVDARGMHRSEGSAGAWTPTDALDYAELIEWCARQPWSTGAVGLCGVSYLAMSQWKAAALRPPALKAIIPWEGATDLLREFAYQDGVRESGFVPIWWNNRMKRGRNKRFAMAEDFLRERDARPFDDDWWASKRPALAMIDVPALVCASWSDQGLHTRGSLLGFENIASTQKWLFTHGRRKWETFYGDEARDTQRRFLDHFLKGADNGWNETPRVRLEVRMSLSRWKVRGESAWPLPNVTYTPLYLNGADGTFESRLPRETHQARYATRKGESPDRASFTHRFAAETELTGTMSLKLWVSTSAGTDLDLFVKLRKFDAVGGEMYFYGYNGFAKDGVAKGWLRVSHRATDPRLSRPGMPWHSHLKADPVQPNEIVPVEIEILASSTLFEAGSTLRIDVLGRDADRYPAFRHRPTVNKGWHSIHTGATYDSHLLIPVAGG